jgi:hypothetical protein
MVEMHRATIEGNKQRILELRQENEKQESLLENLQLALHREEESRRQAPKKIVAKKVAKKKHAKKKPAKKKPAHKGVSKLAVVPDNPKCPVSSLERVILSDQRAALTFARIFDAYALSNEGNDGVSIAQLATAVNAGIPNKKDHIAANRLAIKIRVARNSQHPEISKLFKVTGKPKHYRVTVNQDAAANLRKAS